VLNKKNVLLVLSTLFLIIADQISKQLITLHILPGRSISVVNEYISFTLVKNKGMITGFFPDFPQLTISVTIFALIIFIYFCQLKLKRKDSFGVILVIAGTIGNLWDRILKGGVIDFIDVRFWPIFNLADIFMTVGVVLILYGVIFLRVKCTE